MIYFGNFQLISLWLKKKYGKTIATIFFILVDREKVHLMVNAF